MPDAAGPDVPNALAAWMQPLPPHKFTHQVRNNVPVVINANPTICSCLYVGNQAAYDSYRQTLKAKISLPNRSLTPSSGTRACGLHSARRKLRQPSRRIPAGARAEIPQPGPAFQKARRRALQMSKLDWRLKVVATK
jgi:hypothetical protein